MMARYLVFRSSLNQGRVFVLTNSGPISAISETNDGHSVLVLESGANLTVTAPSRDVMAKLVPPPQPPLMLANIPDPTNPTPQIKGTGEPGNTVTLYEEPSTLGSAVVEPDGTFSLNTTPLSVGPHFIVAKQSDILGMTSEESSSLQIVIEPQPAPPPPPELPTGPTGPTGGSTGPAGGVSGPTGSTAAASALSSEPVFTESILPSSSEPLPEPEPPFEPEPSPSYPAEPVPEPEPIPVDETPEPPTPAQAE